MATIRISLAKCLLMAGLLFSGVFLAGGAAHGAIACNEAAGYSAKPIFIANAATPNIMLLFSNDHTNFYAGYGINTTYNDEVEYYGYFDPDKEYVYDQNYFRPVGYMTSGHQVTASGRWSGNFLNWATMCHADFVRKALTGGKRDIDSSDHTILIRGDIPTDGTSLPGHEWIRTITNAQLYTPFSGTQTFTNRGVTMVRSGGTTYQVRVEVCNETVGVEKNAVYYENGKVWKPEGLLQSFRDKVKFGLMTYSYAKDDAGGVVRVNIHDISDEFNPTGGTIANSDGIAGFINDFQQKGWDPVAELFYEAVKYFRGLTPTPEFCVSSPDGGFQVLCNQGGQTKNWTDPIESWCQNNFVIIINDEYPSRDSDKVPGSKWPTALSNKMSIDVKYWANLIGDYEGITNTYRSVGQVGNGPVDNSCTPKLIGNLGEVRGICPSEGDDEGSYYSAALAYYAHVSDLRDSAANDQTLTTYAIAFRATPSGYEIPPPPMNQLYLAAKYGGFDDVNRNGRPDPGEWEGDTANGYTWPRNFAHAESGKDFEDAMLKILNDILRKASSGTAASVVTTSEGGEGQLYQAYFEPNRTNSAGNEEVTWIGFLQSLWIDDWGNLREDTNGDHRLKLSQDKIVVIRYDESQNRTIVDRYSDCNSDGDPDPVFDSNCDGTPNIGSPAKETVSLSDLKPIWEASSVLGRKSPANRVIKTFADKNMNSVVNTNEFIDFTIGNKNVIKPFLGGVVTGDLDNVINYIRGSEVTGFRNRVLTDGDTATRYVLGDIITSTPTPVAAPMDNYDMIYGDKTYLNYYRKYKDRPTYIFAGANDGMLHAFYGGRFHPTDDPSTATLAEDAWIEVESGKTLGDEVWAYIPKNVLPHLKWLTCQSYPHVYYVDLKPRIFDARIFQTDPDGTPAWDNPNAIHPNGWGTILVCGMRFGGPNITVKADFDGSGGNSSSTKYFKSAYFAIDITQLDNPRLLWEKTYDQMGYTFSYPAIMRLQNGTASKSVVAYADQKWVIVLGNGPTDFNGDPSGYGHIYVVDLLTGNLVRDVQTATTGNVKEFMGSPVAVDLDTNYDTDVVYIGSTIKNSNGSYSGKMYRLAADNNDTGVTPNFDPAQWVPSLLMDVGKPITAAPGVSQIADSIWVYFGTGRYIGQQDKTSTALQSFYGIEDPCSFVHGTCGNALPGTASVSAANLLDVTNISVYETGYVTGLPSGLHTWNDLLNAFSGESNFGWVLNLAQPSGGLPSERILAKPAVIGGLVIFPSFFPNSDVCAFSGDSRLYSLFYGTGTAWQQSTIGTSSTQTVTVNSKTLKKILTNTALGPGLPSQVAIHVGAEQGGKTFTQMSTSSIFQLSFMPAMPMKSGFLYWRETLD